MAQRAARIDAPPRASHDRPPDRPFEDLGREWTILPDCRLRPADRSSHPTVLIHPARGVAVVDVFPSATPGAVNAVHARLDAARFPAIFSGHLPVVHLRVAPRQMASLPTLLDDAFDEEATLRLPGGDAWVRVATRALTSEQPGARSEPQRPRAAERVRERRRWVSALRSGVAVLVCAAALAGVLGALVNRTPMSERAPTPAPVAAVAPPPAAVAEPGGSPSVAVAPLPEAAPAAPPPAAAALGGAEVAAPRPEESPPPAPVRTGVEVDPSPTPAQTAPPPRRRQDPAQPPERQAAPARKAAERPSQRRQQEAEAPAPSPEAGQDRCRRVSASIGSGAPLSDADMRFFNEACIRW